ncbi:hypothetical protein BGZ60DRAFT_522935 [Tricladium varicosporioides]|nr:hypothetical protein BGZ60DRAFT_522935 [Hymenoscyphus varicosporioides]
MAETSSWLTFDVSATGLSSTVPKDIILASIMAIAKDIYEDTANAVIVIALFSRLIPTLGHTAGASLSYNLSSHFRNPSDIEISLQTNSEELWLILDPATFEFLVAFRLQLQTL